MGLGLGLGFGAREVPEAVEQADEEHLDFDEREAALHVRGRDGVRVGVRVWVWVWV